jgi:cob(I)alamin adenosyltransferase
MDLQSTLKQLNNNLFSPCANISKNKSKKKLTSLEEEMIVRMFEKLVVNCKGRPVDFVKSYLDQYHSEKSVNSTSSTFQGNMHSSEMTTRS